MVWVSMAMPYPVTCKTIRQAMKYAVPGSGSDRQIGQFEDILDAAASY